MSKLLLTEVAALFLILSCLLYRISASRFDINIAKNERDSFRTVADEVSQQVQDSPVRLIPHVEPEIDQEERYSVEYDEYNPIDAPGTQEKHENVLKLKPGPKKETTEDFVSASPGGADVKLHKNHALSKAEGITTKKKYDVIITSRQKTKPVITIDSNLTSNPNDTLNSITNSSSEFTLNSLSTVDSDSDSASDSNTSLIHNPALNFNYNMNQKTPSKLNPDSNPNTISDFDPHSESKNNEWLTSEAPEAVAKVMWQVLVTMHILIRLLGDSPFSYSSFIVDF